MELIKKNKLLQENNILISNIPNACSPIFKNTTTAPIKPEAKPSGTPIAISANNPNMNY